MSGDPWPAFLASSFLLTLAPGPDNLATLGIGLSQGRRAASGFGLGCGLGCLTHTTWTVLGLSAVLAASPPLFTFAKVIGAGYLVVLGVLGLRRSSRISIGAAPVSASRTFTQQVVSGFLANAINPKVSLFFLSFLPQFVSPMEAAGPVRHQLLLLGLAFTGIAILTFLGIAACAGSLSQRLQQSAASQRVLQGLASLVFIGLGLRLLIATPRG